MKKLTIALALILCLVVAVFAFASCDKKKSASTTAAKTGATGCAHAWGEFVVDLEPTCSDAGVKSRYCTKCGAQDPNSITEIETIAHVPAAEYTTDKEPTCSNVGYKSKHCTVCGQIDATTVETIPVDSNAHVIDNWIVTKPATLFEDGNRHGLCAECKKDIPEVYKTEIVELKYTTNSGSTHTASENARGLLGENEHYFTSASGAGVDLFFEYSILWNPTLKNVIKESSDKNYGEVLAATMNNSSGADGNDLIWMSLKNSAPNSSCTYAGGFEFTATRTVEVGPHGMSQLAANGNSVGNDYTDFPNIGGSVQADYDHLDNGHEWGWHRIGVRVHEELLNEAQVKIGEAPEYLIWVECYLDGALIFKLSNRVDPEFNKSSYRDVNLLFTVSSESSSDAVEYNGLYYKDISSDRYVSAIRETFKKTESGTAYFVYGDLSIFAGSSFNQSVARNPSPAANTYTTKDGTEISAPIWYTINP